MESNSKNLKIQIIGYSGSGKSTLAKKLGIHFDIPYLHLDNVQFYGDWEERSKEEQNKIVDEFLENNDSWVIDGNYSPTVPVNLQQSVQTSDNIYWGDNYINNVNEATVLNNNGLWNSFVAYGDIRDSGAVASIHCLCDYIFHVNFDAYGNMVDFGVSEYNDRN